MLGGRDVLLLPDALDHAVPAVERDEADAGEDGDGAEAAGGEVALGKAGGLAFRSKLSDCCSTRSSLSLLSSSSRLQSKSNALPLGLLSPPSHSSPATATSLHQLTPTQPPTKLTLNCTASYPPLGGISCGMMGDLFPLSSVCCYVSAVQFPLSLSVNWTIGVGWANRSVGR